MTKKMELCQARHEIPQAVDGSIFGNIVDPTDLIAMKTVVAEKLQGVSSLELYVTGLTVALVEVINYCHENGVELTLMHYNRDTNDYYSQKVSK